ncbi:arylamine N-acetyltransferase family protein [Gordonia zhaorongruii]|uniref:arylamine N-acetyltransferase family protein n=1 Tax=Gordonia zhaorongruii TaxID=2597659 RepID=UPI0010495195|nr:arylamine N-acetyltransferase [Gordonia zhaorongruii]
MGLWHGDDLDLTAYFARIGFTGRPEPTPATLRDMHRAHTTSIPFENLEIMLGRDVPLDLKSLQRKLVRSARGGYCFEHAALFAAALERIGFRFTALTARVTLGGDPVTRPATHALLVVEFDDGARFLCDVGFGRGPLEPIELVAGPEHDQSGWRFRLSASPTDDLFRTESWILWQHDGEWIDRHTFTLNPQFPIDFHVGNHFVHTSSSSPFTKRPFVQRFTESEHRTLDGTTLTTTAPDGGRAVHESSPEDLPQLLADVFAIELDATDSSTLAATESARQAAATA